RERGRAWKPGEVLAGWRQGWPTGNRRWRAWVRRGGGTVFIWHFYFVPGRSLPVVVRARITCFSFAGEEKAFEPRRSFRLREPGCALAGLRGEFLAKGGARARKFGQEIRTGNESGPSWISFGDSVTPLFR